MQSSILDTTKKAHTPSSPLPIAHAVTQRGLFMPEKKFSENLFYTSPLAEGIPSGRVKARGM